jgi:tRNA G18 (ribose-2'-O)-methylase SpoU
MRSPRLRRGRVGAASTWPARLTPARSSRVPAAAQCPVHADATLTRQRAGRTRVSPRSSRHHPGGYARRGAQPGRLALLLVLDGVTDPHNLGTCLRNADAFGAQAVIVPKDRAAGVNATVAKAASGAADTVPVITVTNLARALRALKEKGVWLLGADVGGESLFDADLTGPVAWVLGAEGSGLRRLTRETCDRIVGIPLVGTVESERGRRQWNLPLRDGASASMGMIRAGLTKKWVRHQR